MNKLSGKKVLVTGADGFIGSHLVERLVEEGCRVKAFAFYNSFNSWGWLDSIDPIKLKEVEVFTGDIRDPNGVRTATKDVELVFHLAALIAIPFSYHSPDSYVETNIRGTLNVLQACRDFGVEKLLVTSTSEVYGTAQYVPIDEKHPRQGQSPYAATKIGADHLTESFHKSFGLPVTIVRPFNTYGPRQSARAVIPTIITQLVSGKHKLALGDTRPTRDLLFVKDTVNGFLRIAMEDQVIGEEINIASQREVSINDLAYKIAEIMNKEIEIERDQNRVRPAESEVFRLLGSNEKIKKLTGWEPIYSLEAGLTETINWFSEDNNFRNYKPHIYNI